jgi:hypothetical protein
MPILGMSPPGWVGRDRWVYFSTQVDIDAMHCTAMAVSSMKKFQGTRAKMDPVIDELLGGKAALP